MVFGFIISLSSCFGQKSELLKFDYQGYSDTIYALIQGHIFTESGFIKEPLDSAEIISYRPSPNDTITYTDSQGYFLVGFCYGTYSILIKKEGFQSIRLVNYESDPDQISCLEAILRKGKGEMVYDISKNKINK
jgi:hypothetical protein